MSKRRVRVLAALGLSVLLIALTRVVPVEALGKISPNPAAPTVNEGSSQLVNLQLDAPIICPIGSPTCDVELVFDSTDPSRASVSGTTTWLDSEWAQMRTISIDTVDNGTFDTGETVTLSATAVSDSVYYSGYVVSVAVTLANIEAAPPSPTPSPSPTPTPVLAAPVPSTGGGAGVKGSG